MVAAINQALEHIETQALKSNGRRRTTHRKAKDKSWKEPVEAEAETQIAVGANAATAVPVVVHKFPRSHAPPRRTW